MKKRIGYIILLISLLGLYIWTNAKMTLWALLITTLTLIVVMLINIYISRKIEIEYESVQDENNGILKVVLINNSRLPANHIECVVRCENIVFKQLTTTDKLSLSVASKSKAEFQIPIKSKYVGCMEISMDKCKVFDWFSIGYRNIKTDNISAFYSYPKNHIYDIGDIKDGVSEGEEETYKHVVGNDISEILQIREYRQGDSIKTIHWKLSAKAAKTMVKELDCPNDNSLLIIYDYTDQDNIDANNDVITAVCNVSNLYMKERKAHTVLRMDTSKNMVMERAVFEPEEYDVLCQEILDTEAKRLNRTVADYVMDENIYSRYAKIIYVRPKYMEENSGIVELENCYIMKI